MTVKWNPDFPLASAAVSGDVIVGLLGGTANERFPAESWLFKAQNLADVASQTTAFNNVSPVTTKGDLIYRDATNNVRLPIGTTGQIFNVDVSGIPAWVANPGLLIANNLSDVASVSTTLTNLGLGTTNTPTFNFVKVSSANALTAHSGGGQGSALALTKGINRVTTVAVAGDSVKLPAATAGSSVVVINAAAANAMDCFPATGEIINALSANTALSIIANKTVIFFCAVNGTWNSVVTA
jgi:hypothetical protein